MTTSEKWKIALKITISVAFAFFKGENKALQMLVSRFLESLRENKICVTDKYSRHIRA